MDVLTRQIVLMIGGTIEKLKSSPGAVEKKALDVSGTLEPSPWILESQIFSLLPILYIHSGLLVGSSLRSGRLCCTDCRFRWLSVMIILKRYFQTASTSNSRLSVPSPG